jgi:4Fe-4S ferredoxin
MNDKLAARADCKKPAGEVKPKINPNYCEGTGACVEVCPYDVFERRTLTAAEKKSLSFFARLKAAAHGNKQGFVIHPEACHACGLCVQACPERAIRLVPFAEA